MQEVSLFKWTILVNMELSAPLAVASSSMQFMCLTNVHIGNCHFYTKNFIAAQISSPFSSVFALCHRTHISNSSFSRQNIHYSFIPRR